MQPLVSAALSLGLVVQFAAAAHAQTSAPPADVYGYVDIGRIQWVLPKRFDHYLATPEFTTGPRIKCTEGSQECEIGVLSRDLDKTEAQRRDELAAQLLPHAQESAERAVRLGEYGGDPRVVYATLTDPRPDEPYRLLTAGYRVIGPAVIHFYHLGSDPAQVRQVLEVVASARPLDTREIWAWRLADYKAVCEARFPAYRRANDAAFASSVFARVDVVKFFRDTTPTRAEDIPGQLARGREDYAKQFDAGTAAEKRSFCEGFPKWVAEAAKDVGR